MMRIAAFAVHALHLSLLRSASLMVPAVERAEWYAEWASELWHVRRACAPDGTASLRAESEITAFCLGALQDAAYLRSQRERTGTDKAIAGSAGQCVLVLWVLVALCAFVAGLLPGLRSEREAAQSASDPGVILIQEGADAGAPSISTREFREWRSHQQRFFDDLAFYRAEQLPVHITSTRHGNWMVAHASENLFGLLGLPITASEVNLRAKIPQAFLSDSAWRRDFGSEADIVGQTVIVEDYPVRIAGIVSAGSWRLPGTPDLWLLESGAKMSRDRQDAAGYLIGRLSAAGRAEMAGNGMSITAVAPGGGEIELRGCSIATQASGSWSIYFFALFLAVLSLPAITSVSASESNFTTHPPSLRARVTRWSFLAAKLVLVAGIGYFGSVDIAYCAFPDYSPTAEFLQFMAAFNLCLFGLRWALRDQSQRCPVCLRLVTHPAQVGIASCNFLGWNGTEMICTGGHALLHVPSLPTSWFGRQRWTYLDTSWDFLFADSRAK